MIELIGCFQDGAAFYAEGEHDWSFGPIAEYPELVSGDHDAEGVQKARERFAEEHPDRVRRVAAAR